MYDQSPWIGRAQVTQPVQPALQAVDYTSCRRRWQQLMYVLWVDATPVTVDWPTSHADPRHMAD